MCWKEILTSLRRRWVYLTVTLYIVSIPFVMLNTDSRVFQVGDQKNQLHYDHRNAFASTFHRLLDHTRLPMTADNFTIPSGETFRLPIPSSPTGFRFQTPIGKKLLILDVDSRSMNETGGLLNSTWATTERIQWETSGRLNHYLFAQIHGYDYQFVRVPNLRPELWGTWSKVSVIKEKLRHYAFVVFTDADILFPYLHVPLEWLFNYWDIQSNNLVTMAMDPLDPLNFDMYGKVVLNTGFLIAQRSPRAHELFEAWETCPKDERYPGCSYWSFNWSHEQAAFANYIRYDFNWPDDVKAIPCHEANGNPEVANITCAGKLVRHYWATKAAVTSALEESIMQYFIHDLFDQFHDNYDNIVSTTRLTGVAPDTQSIVVNDGNIVITPYTTTSRTPGSTDTPEDLRGQEDSFKLEEFDGMLEVRPFA